MQMMTEILRGTPWWVWPLLALLIWLGLQSAKPRITRVQRILIVPAAFIGWGLISLVTRSLAAPVLGLAWLAAVALGGVLALLTIRFDAVRVDRSHGLVRFPGSWLPLTRNLAIFFAKFALAVAIARLPAMRDQLSLWDIGVSGAFSGYFYVWLARFFINYRRAPETDLTIGEQTGN